MDALKLRKDVNKAGLLQAVRTVFDQVADPVSDRKFSIGACLMSGLAVFLEKHAALLPFDLSICARGYGGGSEPAPSVRSGAGSLRHGPAAVAGSDLPGAHSMAFGLAERDPGL